MTDNLKQLFDYFKKNDFKQSKKTIQNWMEEVKRLMRKYKEEDKLKAFNDYDYIVSVKDSIEGFNSQQKFVSNISQVIKHYDNIIIDDDNKEKLKILNSKVSKEAKESRQKHHTPKSKYIDWLDLYKLFECFPENSIEYLFLATTFLIPPRRRDWSHAIFVKEKPEQPDTEKNYVILHDNNTVELLFYKSKNSEYIISWNRILDNSNFEYLESCPLFNPNKLAELLINSYNSDPREQVFSYNTIYQKVYKKNKLNFDLCPDDIRHSFADYIWIDNSNIENYYIYSITQDIGDTNPMTFRGYSTLAKEEQEIKKKKENPKEINEFDGFKEDKIKFEEDNIKIDLQINDLNIIKSNNLDKINIINKLFELRNVLLTK
jgi:hypothetical protein